MPTVANKTNLLIVACSLALFCGSANAMPTVKSSLENQVIKAMAKTPNRNDVSPAGNMNRYIVEHKCSKSQLNSIAGSLGGEPFKIVTVFEFTKQLLVETTETGAARLKKQRCVTFVEKDSAVGPASSG